MSLSPEAQRDLNIMILYILQESWEKAEEIEIKIEEAYLSKKNKIIIKECQEIDKYYKKLEKNVLMKCEIERNRTKTNMKLEMAKAQREIMLSIFEDVKICIQEDVKQSSLYKHILKLLIIDGLYKLMEPNIKIRCVKKDLKLITLLTQEIKIFYDDTIKKPSNIVVDQEIFLPENVIGGVELLCKNNKIIVTNTLVQRLKIITENKMHVLNHILFNQKEKC